MGPGTSFSDGLGGEFVLPENGRCRGVKGHPRNGWSWTLRACLVFVSLTPLDPRPPHDDLHDPGDLAPQVNMVVRAVMGLMLMLVGLLFESPKEPKSEETGFRSSYRGRF